MKREKYMTILLVMCMLSYFMMVNLSMTAVAEDLSNYQAKDVIKRDALIYDLRNLFLEKKELIEYTQSLTGFEYDDSEFIVNECNDKNLDLFIVLGVIKRESNFDPKAQGAAGERGLGQLMENTARPVAENLGYVYDPDKLYDARYNLKLTITQIAYLYDLYDKDIHKALTAYNRGQQGLTEYMESSENKNSAVSEYSEKVLQFAQEYKNNFWKSTNVNS
ncbi:MAG: lytic transglycosylase domain-containing protein [Sedimentibacter sp.]